MLFSLIGSDWFKMKFFSFHGQLIFWSWTLWFFFWEMNLCSWLWFIWGSFRGFLEDPSVFSVMQEWSLEILEINHFRHPPPKINEKLSQDTKKPQKITTAIRDDPSVYLILWKPWKTRVPSHIFLTDFYRETPKRDNLAKWAGLYLYFGILRNKLWNLEEMARVENEIILENFWWFCSEISWSKLADEIIVILKEALSGWNYTRLGYTFVS